MSSPRGWADFVAYPRTTTKVLARSLIGYLRLPRSRPAFDLGHQAYVTRERTMCWFGDCEKKQVKTYVEGDQGKIMVTSDEQLRHALGCAEQHGVNLNIFLDLVRREASFTVISSLS